MKIAIFSTKPYDREFLSAANVEVGHDLLFLEPTLGPETAILAREAPTVCAFVNDDLGAESLERLRRQGVGHVALRCAGFNHVDLRAASELGVRVTNVPAYSPHSVAEHTVTLMLALNRKIHRAYTRVREGNFSLQGLLGFDMKGRTVGIVGTGKIGAIVATILQGFGCRVLACDQHPSRVLESRGVEYTDLDRLLAASDIVSLHCPLTPETHHLIGDGAFARMKDGVMLINTSRGALVDTPAVIRALKSGTIGALGLDVYEEEGDLFFEDLSGEVLQDDTFARLLTFPNVIITGHQAFFTRDALENIARTTLDNVRAIERGEAPVSEVTADRLRR